MLEKKQDKLIQHSILLLAATQVANVANMLFQMFMGRMLSDVEFGTLVVMLNIVLIFGQPLEALRMAMAHFSARLAQDGRAGDIKHLVRQWSLRILWLAIPVTILGTLCAGPIATAFKIDSRLPIYITTLTIAGACFMPIVAGALHGIQAFIWMTVVSQGWGVVRLLAGAALVYFVSQEAFWALSGQAVGVVASVMLGILGLWILIGKEKRTEGERGWREFHYFGYSFLALSGFSILMNADVPIIKYFFSPEEAGLFAKAAVIGRTAIFLPMPIAGALFPKVVSEGVTSAGDWRTMMKAVVFAALIIGAAVLGCLLLPWVPLWILYGIREPSSDMANLVRCVVLAMSPLGLTFMLTNFELAQHRFKAVPVLLGCAVAYMAGVAIWHESVWQIVGVLGCVSTLSMILLVVNLPWNHRTEDDVSASETGVAA